MHSRVLTLDAGGGSDYDERHGVSVRRVRAPARLGPGRNVPLNAIALAEAARFRPELTLSAHIVASPAAFMIARLTGAPYVQYFHANEIGGKPRLAAFAARHAAASIAVSTYTAGLLARVGVPGDGVRLIPPGVDLPPAQPQRQPSAILTVARLNDSYKGHDVLLAALPAIRARVPEVEWVVIGEGPLRVGLEAEARAAGLAGCIRFLGAVSDTERDSWLDRADVFAMPSRLPGGGLAGEGFGIVFLEAGSHGIPVVAGNVGGAVDAVAAGQTGLLVDPTDERAVADAIASLLLDPQLARRMGAAASARAREYAWPVIAARVQSLLLELLGR